MFTSAGTGKKWRIPAFKIFLFLHLLLLLHVHATEDQKASQSCTAACVHKDLSAVQLELRWRKLAPRQPSLKAAELQLLLLGPGPKWDAL